MRIPADRLKQHMSESSANVLVVRVQPLPLYSTDDDDGSDDAPGCEEDDGLVVFVNQVNTHVLVRCLLESRLNMCLCCNACAPGD